MRNHYNYVFDSITKTYNFTTKNYILYRVAFVVDETFSEISGETISNVYQIIVEKANESIEPFDPIVSKTIEDIIEKFFRKIENSLIYVCSDDDEKAKLRHKIFDRWYKKSKYRESIVKIDNVIQIHTKDLAISKIYTSFMFHKANSNFEKLIEIYQRIEDVLNEEK